MRVKKLNILTYRWHVPHQYELWRLGHTITMAQGAGTALCDSWSYDQRPLPSNAHFTPFDQINPSDYDLAILHFDENVLRPDLCNGKEAKDWGDTFKAMVALTSDIPQIAICHGTPQFVGQYDPDFRGSEPIQIFEESRVQLVEFLKDIFVVCNSNQAEKEWGFSKSTTIWHGFSPEEYVFGTHERDCLAPLSSSISKRAYYMGHYELEKLKSLLENSLSVDFTAPSDPEGTFLDKQAWAIAKYENYRREIAQFSFYLNTTLRSPMPRSRGEAMMSGVIPLSLRNHDADLFIQNEVNGYVADTVEELTEFALFLKKHPQIRNKVARAARETAITHFHKDRYLAEWSKLIVSLL